MGHQVLSFSRAVRNTRLKSDLILLLVALVWGSGFVAQRIASQHLGFLLFNGSRFLLGALILVPINRFRWQINRTQLPWVIGAGLLLAIASGFQQAGLQTTSIGNTGFITGLYVLFIPIFLWLIWREQIRPILWIAAALAVAGISLLSSGYLPGITGPLRINSGDSLVLVGSFFWAFHVIVVGLAARRMDPYQFAMGQFLVTGVVSILLGLLFQADTLPGLGQVWGSVVYSAVFVIGVGFTLQGVGQKHAPATDASLIMSLETVFSALFGMLLMSEMLNAFQLLGAALILAAIFLAQIFQKPKLEEPQP